MGFDWSTALVTLSGSGILFISAYLTRIYEKSIFAPGTAMLFTWSIGLLFLAFLPLIGFYPLSEKAVLLYVIGSIWFATVALLTLFIINKFSTLKCAEGELDQLNFNKLILFWYIVSFMVFPLIVQEILKHGSNLTEISYNIRRLSLSGEEIISPMINNVMVFITILSNIILYGVTKKKVKLTTFLAVALPFLFLSMVVSGRSGLVSLILGWFVIISIFSNKKKLSTFIVPILLLFLILFGGALFVKKFDVENESTGDILIIFLEHIFGYLYQGPILFSRYFNNEIDIATNWDFLNSACHVVSKLNWCTPLRQHADFTNYGPTLLGNVYTMYFSIIPNYGLYSLFPVFLIYSSLLAILFYKFKSSSIFAVILYPAMFAAIVLSPFTDSIGYSFYFVLKVIFFSILIKFLFTKAKNV